MFGLVMSFEAKEEECLLIYLRRMTRNYSYAKA